MNQLEQNDVAAAPYIAALNMNGLQGRMLRAPSTNQNTARSTAPKTEILLMYGHHAMLERWWGIVENLQEYGTVTMPDLPGFGGMQSFYKIGKQPTIDNYADYLASFIRLRYKKRRITIIGISFGFVVATRMLQRYPDLAKKVDLFVSLVGFMHKDDFYFQPVTRRIFRTLSRLFSTYPIAFFIRYALLNGPIIRSIYGQLPAGKRRLSSMDPAQAKLMLAYDIKLWQANDVRTHWSTTSDFLDLDNCKSPIHVPAWHVASNSDPYFNNQTIEQHMLVVFNDYNQSLIDTKAHSPNVVADKAELAILLPDELRRVLTRLNSKHDR